MRRDVSSVSAIKMLEVCQSYLSPLGVAVAVAVAVLFWLLLFGALAVFYLDDSLPDLSTPPEARYVSPESGFCLGWETGAAAIGVDVSIVVLGFDRDLVGAELELVLEVWTSSWKAPHRQGSVSQGWSGWRWEGVRKKRGERMSDFDSGPGTVW